MICALNKNAAEHKKLGIKAPNKSLVTFTHDYISCLNANKTN